MRFTFLGVGASLLVVSVATLSSAQTTATPAPSGPEPTLPQTFDYLTQKLSKTVTLNSRNFFKVDNISFDRCKFSFKTRMLGVLDTPEGLARKAGEDALADPSKPSTENDEEDSETNTATLADLNPATDGSDIGPYSQTAVSINIGSLPGRSAVLPSTVLKDDNGNVMGTYSQISIFASVEDAPHIDAAFRHAVELCREHPETSPKEMF